MDYEERLNHLILDSRTGFYLGYKEREKLKLDGWRLFHELLDAREINLAAICLLDTVIYAYWRQSCEGLPHDNLPQEFMHNREAKEYRDFAENWMWANTDLVPPGVRYAIYQLEGLKQVKADEMPKGCNTYMGGLSW